MKSKFEFHESPYRSRLEKWRSEITAMRSQNWPYSRIVEWLALYAQISVTKEAVRKFCLVRGIQKNSPSRPNSQARQKSQPVPKRKMKIFEYKDGGPIQTKRE